MRKKKFTQLKRDLKYLNIHLQYFLNENKRQKYFYNPHLDLSKATTVTIQQLRESICQQ